MARRSPKSPPAGRCPLECSGGRSDRQHDLTEGQSVQLSAEARKQIGAATARRCSYCGAVYLYGGRVLGQLDNGVRGEGWHPFKSTAL